MIAITKKSLLVAGASGYLGSHLVNYLSQYYSVTAVVRRTSDLSRLSYGTAAVTVTVSDNDQDLESIFKSNRPDVVINTVGHYGREGQSALELVEANLCYALKLLSIAKKSGVGTFIHTGTALPDKVSVYSSTKRMFDKLAQFQKLGSMRLINIELEHFFGPKDDNRKFVQHIIELCISGSLVEVSLGTQQRDFIYIEDVVSAYHFIINNVNYFQGYTSVPVGAGSTISIRTLVELIHKLSMSTSEVQFGAFPMRGDELMYSCANLQMLGSLGWTPKCSIIDGIKKTLAYEE